MNEVLNLVPGGKTGISKALELSWETNEVQAFVSQAQKQFNESEEFRSEIQKAGFKIPDQDPSPGVRNLPDLSGLTESEKERVMATLRPGVSSAPDLSLGSSSSPVLVSPEQHSSVNWNKTTLIALAVAAVAAIILFRGVVFRTLYLLATKLPFIGSSIKAKFGEPKEILSGKLSEDSKAKITAQIEELESLLRIRGCDREGTPHLARLLTLLASLNAQDVVEVYNVAKDYRNIVKNI